MKFSWKWLNELVNLNKIPLKEIENTLTLAGFEVENIENKPEIQDQTININITANRADVSSMIGLAREVSTIFSIPLNESLYNKDYIKAKKFVENNIKFKSNILLDCHLNTIQLVKQKPSPIWLKNYLAGCGIQSTNILSDICEYINMKWGQDIKILDLQPKHISKTNDHFIDQFTLNIEYIDEDQNNSMVYELLNLDQDSNLPYIEMIKYRNSILSILGITCNSNFFCNKNSTTLLILGQICKTTYIEETILKIKNKTSQINKQLKGISRDDFDHAYNEALYLILTLNHGYLGSYHYTYHNIYSTNPIININEKIIHNTLGPCIHSNNSILSQKTINQIFKQLKFETIYNNGNFTIKIPEYRSRDIKRNIDIIEEIVRIYGFDKFMDKMPTNKKPGFTSTTSQFVKKIRCILRDFGLHEIINHSLENHSEEYSNTIQVYNPLLEDQSQLKECLVKQLIDTSIYNRKQKNLPLECFEVGKIFHHEINNDTNYQEEIHVAGILGNPSFSRELWSEKNKELTWFQAKGFLEEFFEKLHAKIDWIHIQNHIDYKSYYSYKNIYHPYRTAILCNQKTGKTIGVFGQLNATTKSLLNNSYNQYIFEINVNKLMKTIHRNTHLNYNAKTYSLYPSVTRDISLTIPVTQSVESVKEYILNQNHALVESVKVFNEYKKNSTSKYNRHVGFRITYRSKNRTLNDADIQQIDNGIQNLLKIKL